MISPSRILLLATFLVLTLARTGKFSLPIIKTETVLPWIVTPFPNQYEGNQKHLNSNFKPSSHAAITDPSSLSRGYPIGVSHPSNSITSNIPRP